MNLQQITMPVAEAEKQFAIYRGSIRKRHNAEDHAIMTAYKAISKGTAVISLTEAIKAGGMDERGWPNIAVMRANEQWCWLRMENTGSIVFSGTQYPNHRDTFRVLRFPDGTLPPNNDRKPSWGWDYRAMVPIVPPNLRPKFKLSNYHVLWEARWEKAPPPPGDPALLKRLGGELYAVLAVWDLTPVERLVLAGRK
jgi:hypothetical protein